MRSLATLMNETSYGLKFTANDSKIVYSEHEDSLV